MKNKIIALALSLAMAFTTAAVLPQASVTVEASSSFATTGLSAASSGKNRVTLKWNAVSGAEGYLVYGQKNGKYGYVGMTTQGTTFNDTNALAEDYNYYWVFPYYKNSAGKMITGSCAEYKFAKGVCAAVTYLKASSVAGGVKLTWQASNGAEEYLVYGIRAGGSYEYVGLTSGTSFTDTKASKTSYNYYWVYASFNNASGARVIGLAPSYTYGRALTSDGKIQAGYVYSNSNTTRIWTNSDGSTTGQTQTKYTANGQTVWGYYGDTTNLVAAINEGRATSRQLDTSTGVSVVPDPLSDSLGSTAKTRVLAVSTNYSSSGMTTSTELRGQGTTTVAATYYGWLSVTSNANNILHSTKYTKVGVSSFWRHMGDDSTAPNMLDFWVAVFN